MQPRDSPAKKKEICPWDAAGRRPKTNRDSVKDTGAPREQDGGALLPTPAEPQAAPLQGEEPLSESKPAEEIARELVARAVEIDGNDNTTALVIRVRGVEQVGMYRGRPYRLPTHAF